VRKVWLVVAVVPLAGCGPGTSHPSVPGADASHGKALIEYYGCGACHAIAGVEPRGASGPSLLGFANRRQIAGTLPNTVSDLIRWIRAPQQVLPGNAMPDLGVGAAGARDIATYLYAH
jgi:cytochrome c2